MMTSLDENCCIKEVTDHQGLLTITLENALLRIIILVDKGSDIVEFRYKPTDTDYLLRLPGGLRSPRSGAGALGDLSFIDTYSGGWNEIFPNGGSPSSYKGAHFGQHGEVSVMPWEFTIVEDCPERVSVKMWVHPHRTPFYLEKTLSLERNCAVLTIDEQLINLAGEEMHCMWGQHIAFGNPFLLAGATIFAPAQKFIVHDAMDGYEPRRFEPGSESHWPTAVGVDGMKENASLVPAFGDAQAQEMAFLAELTDGWYAIINASKKVGFGVRFDHTLFRYIWYWQQLGNVAKGFPWWGRLHTMALEPWTSYPINGLAEAVENGTALVLQPGEKINTTIKAVAFDGYSSVDQITPDGEIISKQKIAER